MASRITVAGPDETEFYNVTIQRDDAGAPWLATDDDGTGIDHTAEYRHDDAGRISLAWYYEMSPATWIWYGYDALGNMTLRAPNRELGTMAGGYYNYGEDGAPRHMTSVSPTVWNMMPLNFSYDRAGRQTQHYDSTLSYDAFDRLTEIDTPSGAVGPQGLLNEGNDQSLRYGYGNEGLRTSLSDGGTVLERWFDADWRVTDTQHQHLIFVGKRLVAQVDAVAASTHYFHQGVSAGPELVTDAAGAIWEERSFEPFGQAVEVQSAWSAQPNYAETPIGALNQPSDAVSGFSYHGARWYAPEIGRWLSPDPMAMDPFSSAITRPSILNGYDYAQQSPLTLWDPDGRAPGLAPNYQTQGDARRAAAWGSTPSAPTRAGSGTRTSTTMRGPSSTHSRPRVKAPTRSMGMISPAMSPRARSR